MPIREIIDFLVEVGSALDFDKNEYMQEALERSLAHNALERRILETTYRAVPLFFDRKGLEFQVDQETGWRQSMAGRQFRGRSAIPAGCGLFRRGWPTSSPATLQRSQLPPLRAVH